MAGKFTESKERRAKEILDNALAYLVETKGESLPIDFESELKQCWKAAYCDLRLPMIDMLKHEIYQPVAVRYMLSCQFPIAAQFKIPLSKLLAIKTFDTVEERESALATYWKRFNKGNA